MALPAIQSLLRAGKLCAIAIPETNTELLETATMISRQTSISLSVISRKDCSAQLLDWVAQYQPDHVFTMTFPWKISGKVLARHPNLFYNFHYGLLPEMRGGDPVFEALRQQLPETGITVHRIEAGLDTGAVLFRRKIPIASHVTHGLLCSQLAQVAGDMVTGITDQLQQAGAMAMPQDESKARFYPKPQLADVCIHWDKQDAAAIEALTKACNPWNKGAYTQWGQWNMRIVAATATGQHAAGAAPGTICTASPEQGLEVACKDGGLIRLDIVYTDEGFMPGHHLLYFGIKAGTSFVNLT